MDIGFLVREVTIGKATRLIRLDIPIYLTQVATYYYEQYLDSVSAQFFI
jgi:hypothetical protein